MAEQIPRRVCDTQHPAAESAVRMAEATAVAQDHILPEVELTLGSSTHIAYLDGQLTGTVTPDATVPEIHDAIMRALQ